MSAEVSRALILADDLRIARLAEKQTRLKWHEVESPDSGPEADAWREADDRVREAIEALKTHAKDGEDAARLLAELRSDIRDVATGRYTMERLLADWRIDLPPTLGCRRSA